MAHSADQWYFVGWNSCKCNASLPGCPKKTWVHESVLRKQGNGEHLQRAKTASCAGSQHYVEGSVCAKRGQQQEGLPPDVVAVGQLQGAVQDSVMNGSVGGSVGSSMHHSLLGSPIGGPTQAQALVAGAQALHVEPPPASCRAPDSQSTSCFCAKRGLSKLALALGWKRCCRSPMTTSGKPALAFASRGGIVGATSGDPSSDELGHFVGCLEFIVATLSACKTLVDGGPDGGLWESLQHVVKSSPLLGWPRGAKRCHFGIGCTLRQQLCG